MNNQQKRLAIGAIGAVIILSVVYLNSAQNRAELAQTPVLNVNTEATLTLTSPLNGSFEVGKEQTITWTSNNYAAPTVSIYLIKKISDNPVTYELVRTIATSTPNNGVAIWIPEAADMGEHLSIQIGCNVTESACSSVPANGELTIIENNRAANTANVRDAIGNDGL